MQRGVRLNRPSLRGSSRGAVLQNSSGSSEASPAMFMDFSTGSLDPRVTYARQSIGTYTNAVGGVSYANSNVVRRSIGPAATGAAGAGWSIVGTNTLITDRNGVPTNATMNTLTQTGSTSFSCGFPTEVETGVMRVWIRSTTVANPTPPPDFLANEIVAIGLYDSTAGVAWGLTADSSASVVGGYTTGVTVTRYGSGGALFTFAGLSATEWTQVEIKRISRFMAIYVYPGGPAATGLSHTLSYSDFQLTQGNNGDIFVPTSGNPYYAPRFDYSETTVGLQKGLLIEGASSNLIKCSEDQANSVWVKYGSPNPAVAGGKSTTASPDGLLTANKLTFGSGNESGIYMSFSSCFIPLTSGVVYTQSVWVRSNAPAQVRLSYFNGTASTFTSNFNTSSAWTRITQTFTTSSTSAAQNVAFTSNSAFTSALVEWWGYQVEAGTAPSTYIPSGLTQIGRAQDEAIVKGIDFSSWYNTAAGFTFVVDYFRGERSVDSAARSVLATNAISPRHFHIKQQSGSANQVWAEQAADRITAVTLASGRNKAAFSCGSTAVNPSPTMVVNGGVPVSSTTTGYTPALSTWLTIGGQSTTSSIISDPNTLLNNSIRSISFYTSPFTTAQLQAVTT